MDFEITSGILKFEVDIHTQLCKPWMFVIYSWPLVLDCYLVNTGMPRPYLECAQVAVVCLSSVYDLSQ